MEIAVQAIMMHPQTDTVSFYTRHTATANEVAEIGEACSGAGLQAKIVAKDSLIVAAKGDRTALQRVLAHRFPAAWQSTHHDENGWTRTHYSIEHSRTTRQYAWLI